MQCERCGKSILDSGRLCSDCLAASLEAGNGNVHNYITPVTPPEEPLLILRPRISLPASLSHTLHYLLMSLMIGGILGKIASDTVRPVGGNADKTLLSVAIVVGLIGYFISVALDYKRTTMQKFVFYSDHVEGYDCYFFLLVPRSIQYIDIAGIYLRRIFFDKLFDCAPVTIYPVVRMDGKIVREMCLPDLENSLDTFQQICDIITSDERRGTIDYYQSQPSCEKNYCYDNDNSTVSPKTNIEHKFDNNFHCRDVTMIQCYKAPLSLSNNADTIDVIINKRVCAFDYRIPIQSAGGSNDIPRANFGKIFHLISLPNAEEVFNTLKQRIQAAEIAEHPGGITAKSADSEYGDTPIRVITSTTYGVLKATLECAIFEDRIESVRQGTIGISTIFYLRHVEKVSLDDQSLKNPNAASGTITLHSIGTSFSLCNIPYPHQTHAWLVSLVEQARGKALPVPAGNE